jgi:hypothetical protein
MEEVLLIIGVILVFGFMSYFNATVTQKKLFALKYIVIAVLFALVFSFEESDFTLMLLFSAGLLHTLWGDLKKHIIPAWKGKQL